MEFKLLLNEKDGVKQHRIWSVKSFTIHMIFWTLNSKTYIAAKFIQIDMSRSNLYKSVKLPCTVLVGAGLLLHFNGDIKQSAFGLFRTCEIGPVAGTN